MPPRLLSTEIKARILAELLAPLEEQEYQLRLLHKANDASMTEVVPGESFTYDERLGDLRKAQDRLLAAAEPDVVEAMRRRMADG